MSLEMLEKLEAKVQMAVDSISLLQMEIDELKEKNDSLAMEAQELRSGRENLVQDNEALRGEHNVWQDRVRLVCPTCKCQPAYHQIALNQNQHWIRKQGGEGERWL